jgi:hypothetical protein
LAARLTRRPCAASADAFPRVLRCPHHCPWLLPRASCVPCWRATRPVTLARSLCYCRPGCDPSRRRCGPRKRSHAGTVTTQPCTSCWWALRWMMASQAPCAPASVAWRPPRNRRHWQKVRPSSGAAWMGCGGRGCNPATEWWLGCGRRTASSTPATAKVRRGAGMGGRHVCVGGWDGLLTERCHMGRSGVPHGLLYASRPATLVHGRARIVHGGCSKCVACRVLPLSPTHAHFYHCSHHPSRLCNRCGLALRFHHTVIHYRHRVCAHPQQPHVPPRACNWSTQSLHVTERQTRTPHGDSSVGVVCVWRAGCGRHASASTILCLLRCARWRRPLQRARLP